MLSFFDGRRNDDDRAGALNRHLRRNRAERERELVSGAGTHHQKIAPLLLRMQQTTDLRDAMADSVVFATGACIHRACALPRALLAARSDRT